jgi:hypothetical protein
MNVPEQAQPGPGWYTIDEVLRYWDGQDWAATEPALAPSGTETKTVIWALALACGVAGALGWDAPVIAYYWPFALGGAGVALSIVASRLEGDTPWWAIIAVIASVIALLIGIDGHNQINEARDSLRELSY